MTRSQSREKEISLPATPKRSRRSSRDGSTEKDKNEPQEGVRRSSRRSISDKSLEIDSKKTEMTLQSINEEADEQANHVDKTPAALLADIPVPAPLMTKSEKETKISDVKEETKTIKEESKVIKENEGSPLQEDTLELEVTTMGDDWKEDAEFWGDIPLPPSNSKSSSRKKDDKSNKSAEKDMLSTRDSLKKEKEKSKTKSDLDSSNIKTEKNDHLKKEESKSSDNKTANHHKKDAIEDEKISSSYSKPSRGRGRR